MEQVNAQTEKIATYETSRTRRSIVDGNLHSDDSNNDEEYASSGFYVREKTSDKKSDSSADNGVKAADVDSKENGLEIEDNRSASPLLNGENSKDDGDNSKDANEATEEKKGGEGAPDSENNEKEVIESEKQEETKEQVENIEDNSVSSSCNNQTTVKQYNNDVSSTSNNVDDTCETEKEEAEKEGELKETEIIEEPKVVEEQENVKHAQSVVDDTELVESNVTEEEHKEAESTEVEKIDTSKTVDSKGEVEVIDESKEVQTVSEPKDVEIVDESNEVQTVSESKDVEVVNESKEAPTVSEPKDVEVVEESKEVPTVSEPKEVETVDESNKDGQTVAESNKVVVIDESKDVEAVEKVDKPKRATSEDIEILDDEPKKNENKSEKTEEIIEIKDNNEEVQQKEAEKSSAAASILKEQLERTASGNDGSTEHDMEMDEDFDPSLLCPDISMDVDEAPVMTNSAPEDGSTSPLPYEPIFSTLVDEITGAEVQIDLTPAEMELRQKMYGPNNPVQTTKVHCTACNVHLGSALTGANNRFVHPLLKVLICKNCYHFYTSGEFEKDEDGSELYCRWCGQGGQVLCCSSCEFVFCKRCIRNNFGQKKFKEIRDSDDWNCFRCEPEQLSSLRASCAEFMEYYRTELARAQALSATNPDLMTTDYTKCCSTPPEKKEEPKTPAPQKTRRKRKEEEDPDYEPQQPEEEPPPTKKLATTPMPINVSTPSAVRPIVPKPVPNPVAMRQIATPIRPPQTTSSQVFKVGNTTFRSRTPGYTIQRPPVSQAPKNSSPGYITIPSSSAPKTTTPGYIKILPQRLPSPSRPPGSYTVVSGTSNGKPTFSTVRPPKPPQPSMPPMKHEWFEKTVRAAARVNSNLSYTLTQLNRQQSQATSVEALAMVHNKLQEVLSTSINSLIQIRKNLRTEFIAGIKNIKFPQKPTPVPPPPTGGPIVVKDDDDVIFVNPTSTASQSQPPPLILSPSVTLTKKIPPLKTIDPFSNPTPSTSGLKPNNISKPIVSTTTTTGPGPLKGGFLKVRSLTALQSVPSECITIPDDPPKRRSPAVTIIEEEDPLKLPESDPLKSTENVSELKPEKSFNVRRKQPQDKEISSTSSSTSKFNPLLVYNVKERPTPEIKKMMDAVVLLKKSPDVDELLVSRGLLVNGASERVNRQKVKKEIDPL